MDRNTLTTASGLHQGDCFYKATDAKKKTYVMVALGAKTETYLVCPSEFYGNRFQNQKTELLKQDCSVVFLRKIDNK